MTTSTTERTTRQQAAAARALARSALYRLLSQALAYPGEEAVAGLRDADLPEVRRLQPWLSPRLAGPLDGLEAELLDADALQREHRRVLGHAISMDCPPCETFFTAPHIFQETQDLSDIGGFLRAFGLELGERERPDHITIELEFMHFVTFKEAYALERHGPAKARLCRDAQRRFVTDHLGRWGSAFGQKLGQKAGAGYYRAVASLLDAFLTAEIEFLRARPEVTLVSPDWRLEDSEDAGCPIASDCALERQGGRDAAQR